MTPREREALARLGGRLRPVWRRIFRKWYDPVTGDRTIYGLTKFLEYGAGTLGVWKALSMFRFPPWIEVAGHVVPMRWFPAFAWAASFRFFYRALLGIRSVEQSAQWRDEQLAWEWIEQQEHEQL